MARWAEALFASVCVKRLRLAKRIVVGAMAGGGSPGGVAGPDVGAYYRRRAEGGVGLIVTEGTWIPHPVAGFPPRVPRFYGEDALAGWRRVCEDVHAAGGRICPQLWHVGACLSPGDAPASGVVAVSPSGIGRPAGTPARAMTEADINAVTEAYAQAAGHAKTLGFDGIEIHAAHGYLIDQFFNPATNHRTDAYGGDITRRTRLAAGIVREIRRRTAPDLPIVPRYSQWEPHDYSTEPFKSPTELAELLAPLVEAGVDAFHCSTRRYWQP